MLIRTVDAYHVRLVNSGEILNIFNPPLRLSIFKNEALFLSSFSLELVITGAI